MATLATARALVVANSAGDLSSKASVRHSLVADSQLVRVCQLSKPAAERGPVVVRAGISREDIAEEADKGEEGQFQAVGPLRNFQRKGKKPYPQNRKNEERKYPKAGGLAWQEPGSQVKEGKQRGFGLNPFNAFQKKKPEGAPKAKKAKEGGLFGLLRSDWTDEADAEVPDEKRQAFGPLRMFQRKK